MPRRKKSSQRRAMVTDAEHQQLLADLTRMINAWAEHAPDEKFAGMTLEEFKKAVQPSFDVDAELARLEWERARLQKILDEDFELPKGH